MLTRTLDNAAPHHARRGGIRGILRKVFSFPVFMGAVLSAGAVAATVWDKAPMVAGKIFAEGDTWWHIVIGERILTTHTWPTADIYSFTAQGVGWIAYEWLGEVIMALAARLGGLRGLAVLLVLLSITYVLLMYYYAWLRSRNPLAAAVAAALLTPVAAACLTMRPQVLAYIFLLITLICLERFKQGHTRSLWLLPPVFLLWVNTHGSFILGFFALGLYWTCGLVSFRWGALVAERRPAQHRRLLLVVSLASVLATMVTPYGICLVSYPFRYIFSRPYIAQVITEWQPLDFSQPFGRLFLLFVLATLVWQVVSPTVHQLESMILLLAAIIESCMHARFVIFFALVYAPILATLLVPWLPSYRPDEDHPVANAVLVAAVVWGLIAFFPSGPKLRQTLERTFPVGAVEYLRQHKVGGRTFNEDTWGGFLIWSLGAQHPVFIDGRAEIYEYSGALSDYIRIAGINPDALSLLHSYRVSTCLLHRGTPLRTLLASSPEWKQVYSDEQSIIFDRVEHQQM